jgi:ferredoxin
MRYKIEVNREGCISCGSCYAIDPDHFESDSEGKSQVIGGSTNGKSIGEFDDEKTVAAESAAESCPVSVITVTKS